MPLQPFRNAGKVMGQQQKTVCIMPGQKPTVCIMPGQKPMQLIKEKLPHFGY